MKFRFPDWRMGIALCPIGIFFCLSSLVADPYTAYGFENEQVRPMPAKVSVDLATISLVILLAASAMSYRKIRRRGVIAQSLIFGTLLFFLAVDAYRICWIEFVVLPQAAREVSYPY